MTKVMSTKELAAIFVQKNNKKQSNDGVFDSIMDIRINTGNLSKTSQLESNVKNTDYGNTFKSNNKSDSYKSDKSDNISNFDNDKAERTTDNKNINNEKNTDTYSKVDKDSKANSLSNTNDKNIDEVKDFDEALGTVANQIRQKLKELLDLSDEEINTALENMGISLFDLVNPDIGKELVLLINNETDMAAAITNEALAQDLSSLNDFYNNDMIYNELGITQEDFLDIVNEATQRLENKQNIETNIGENVELNDQINTQVENPMENITLSDDEGIAEEIMTNDNENNKDGLKLQKDENADNRPRITIENKSDNQQSDSMDFEGNNDSSTFNSDSQTQTTIENNYYENFMANLENAVNIKNTDMINEISEVKQIRDVVNQIVEEIKISIKPDKMTMEMQLNPENLGKVNVSITTKNGELTAKFIVENEIAKEAIESQMDMLRDKFIEQGVKVNAVEVTVSDNNLSKDMSREQKSNEQSGQNRRKRNFDSMGLTDEQEIKDSIINEIMQQNGNKVDFSA